MGNILFSKWYKTRVVFQFNISPRVKKGIQGLAVSKLGASIKSREI